MKRIQNYPQEGLAIIFYLNAAMVWVLRPFLVLLIVFPCDGFSQQVNKKSLDLSSSAMDANMIASLLNGSDYEVINLSNTNISDSELKMLTDNKAIRELNLSGTRVSQQGISRMLALPALEKLSIQGLKLDQRGFTVTKSQRLTFLDISFTDVTDLAQLRQSNISCLNLAWTSINDAGVRNAPAALEDLDLSNTNVTDQGAEFLSRLRQLRVLNLSGDNISDRGVVFLGNLPVLEVLDLSGTKVSDDCIGMSRVFEKLKVIDLSDTLIGDDGVKSICRNIKIESLALGGQVTDRSLTDIAQLKYLRDIALLKSDVTHKGLAKLVANLPLESIRLAPRSDIIDDDYIDVLSGSALSEKT